MTELKKVGPGRIIEFGTIRFIKCGQSTWLARLPWSGTCLLLVKDEPDDWWTCYWGLDYVDGELTGIKSNLSSPTMWCVVQESLHWVETALRRDAEAAAWALAELRRHVEET